MNTFYNWGCGCGSSEPDEEEIERVVREVEEERQPVLIPVKKGDDPIPAPDVFTKKREKVTVSR